MASLSPLTGNLGTRRAIHLLRRASYRFTKQQVDTLAGLSAEAALDLLLTPPTLTLEQPLFDDITTQEVENITWILPPGLPFPVAQQGILRRYVVNWWLHEALNDAGMQHKMMMFLHQYNVVAIQAVNSNIYFDYLSLLRLGAFGNFKTFAKKMVLDNGMLDYLNNTTNTANNPNENFAREFFELFTIGKGQQVSATDYTNYTEDDIVAAAKVFTGLRTQNNRSTVDPETSIPSGRIVVNQHNWAEKTFSTRLQNLTIPAVTVAAQKTAAKIVEELNALVDRVFEQDETARNFCRRLYRFFVGEKITTEIENDIIVPLAAAFKSGGYDIQPTIKQLLSSQHFFDADNTASVTNILGGMVKSPLELALQSISFFNLPIPNATDQARLRYIFYANGVTDRMLLLAGYPLFNAADVAGYQGYYQAPDFSHSWFNSSSIIARYKLPTMLLSGKFSIGNNQNGNIQTKLDIAPWVRDSNFFSDPADPFVLVSELLAFMLPKEVDNARFDYFYLTIFLDNLPPADWTYEWQNYLNSNNATEVTIALERLIKAIMYSQEFQTF
jgi:uncharacterized protein (DUF1800 family)